MVRNSFSAITVVSMLSFTLAATHAYAAQFTVPVFIDGTSGQDIAADRFVGDGNHAAAGGPYQETFDKTGALFNADLSWTAVDTSGRIDQLHASQSASWDTQLGVISASGFADSGIGIAQPSGQISIAASNFRLYFRVPTYETISLDVSNTPGYTSNG
jgi:hypothetical protein